MNTYSKYCPKVWVAKCEDKHEKGELGHTNVRTTQVYAKVVDEKKEKATDVIKIDNLKIKEE